MAHLLRRQAILRHLSGTASALRISSARRPAIHRRSISTPPPTSSPPANPDAPRTNSPPSPTDPKAASPSPSMFLLMTPAGNRATSIVGAIALALSLPLVWNGVHGWYLTLTDRADEIRDERSPAGILLDALMWPYEAAKRLDWRDGRGAGKGRG